MGTESKEHKVASVRQEVGITVPTLRWLKFRCEQVAFPPPGRNAVQGAQWEECENRIVPSGPQAAPRVDGTSARFRNESAGNIDALQLAIRKKTNRGGYPETRKERSRPPFPSEAAPPRSPAPGARAGSFPSTDPDKNELSSIRRNGKTTPTAEPGGRADLEA